MEKSVRVVQHSSLGLLWFIGWLFSIGFLDLGFWKGLLAILVWPYFLGADLAEPAAPPTNHQATIERAAAPA